MHHSSILVRFAITLGTALITSVSGQEPSVVLKSLDNLEKRVEKVEAETANLRKAQKPPVAEKRGANSDSASRSLSARLDSLQIRLKVLETAAEAKKAVAVAATPVAAQTPPTAAPDTMAQGEMAGLRREIRDLTALLKRERTAYAAPAIPSAPAAPAVSAVSAGPAITPAPASPAVSATPAMPIGLELKGDIQIQGERKVTAQSGRDNLDDFWGRFNFGAEYNAKDFQSKINIRVFPEGFGFEPLTGATFDTVGQGSLKVQTAPSSRIVINHAWAKYSLGASRLKIGRFETVETQSDNYGNYVDLGASGKFMSRPASHNAVEFSSPIGPVAASALLGTNDRKLNRGFLRLYGKYAPLPALALSLGYRAPVFDQFKYPDDEILQRFDAGAAYKLPAGWKAFAEAALLQALNKKDDMPLLIGIQPPVGKVLDVLALETEYLKDRKAEGKPREWLFNVHARKTIGRVKIDAGCYSDPADKDWNATQIGLRMTSNIK
ncbi:MAG: hypothetical protein ABI036_08030 [Fibrobacteria bacterium]